MKEEIANVTGDSATMAMPATCKRKYRMFDVPSDVFRRFENGRMKFERWSKFLDETDEQQMSIKAYASKNRNSVIILKDMNTGALRAIRQRSSNGL